MAALDEAVLTTASQPEAGETNFGDFDWCAGLQIPNGPCALPAGLPDPWRQYAEIADDWAIQKFLSRSEAHRLLILRSKENRSS